MIALGLVLNQADGKRHQVGETACKVRSSTSRAFSRRVLVGERVDVTAASRMAAEMTRLSQRRSRRFDRSPTEAQTRSQIVERHARQYLPAYSAR